ncbi:MAG: iron-sulfur cluster repair protein YtfE [Burkholderiaceae bacterium]|nr:iron-sulfur cluster repair protein YtfE [Roseateles sp.]MBV8468989.1 iron-sulfur cluster repair protein YtfE [Burkholderiaceae bacterium]
MNTTTELATPAQAGSLADQSLGQIAVNLPGATAIFRRLRLDFCCGGQVSLRQAAQNKHLDLDAVLRELAVLERPSQAPGVEQPAELIAHILDRYHAVHRLQLPELERMARRVEAVHRDHPEVPAGLAEHLALMEQELLDHMQKEETVLFPLLQRGDQPWVSQPISMMRQEHTEHGAALEKMVALAHEMTPPPGACNTWRALYAGLQQFHDDLISHIHLENNLLFPQFGAASASSCGSQACGCA